MVDIAEILNDCHCRENHYLTLLSESVDNDLTEEFFESYKDDISFIKKIKASNLCTGIILQAIKSLEDVLYKVPVQIEAINRMRVRFNENPK